MFGSSPKTFMKDQRVDRKYNEITYHPDHIYSYVEKAASAGIYSL